MELCFGHVPSPVGILTLAWDDQFLRALDFDGFDDRFHALLVAQYRKCNLTEADIPDDYRLALDAYFAGDLGQIDHIRVRTAGTPFQQQVWAELRNIPAGTTISYGELAGRLAKPGASRAVGRANGSNPVGIVVPCHRVIGADGSLTGYGGGMERKRWLIEHERAYSTKAERPSEPVQRSLSSIFI